MAESVREMEGNNFHTSIGGETYGRERIEREFTRWSFFCPSGGGTQGGGRRSIGQQMQSWAMRGRCGPGKKEKKEREVGCGLGKISPKGFFD